MTLLTCVYVVATIVIAALAIKSTRLAQQNIETMINLEKNRLRPYVLFKLASSIEKRCTYASVKNHGLTAAYNVRVSIDPPLKHHHDTESPLTHRDILFLPPGEEITDIIDASPTFYQEYPQPVFQGAVQYQDSKETEYKEAFKIDLTFLKKRIYVRDASVVDELKEMNETLDLIHRNLQPKEAHLDELGTSLDSLEAWVGIYVSQINAGSN